MSPKGYLVIPILLKHGADKSARNWLNKTPLQLAQEKHNERAIQLLADK